MVNYSHQSRFWQKGRVKTEKLEDFIEELHQGWKLILFGLVTEYRHVHLHPTMLKCFLFRYGGRDLALFNPAPLGGVGRHAAL